MTATEQWIFLCAAHKTPKECPAIGHSHLLSCTIKVYHTASSYPLSDYTRHTLDGAACLLNSNKYFPSRVSIKVTNLFNEHAVSHYFDAFDTFDAFDAFDALDDNGPHSGKQCCKAWFCLSPSLPHLLTCILSSQVTFLHAYFQHK